MAIIAGAGQDGAIAFDVPNSCRFDDLAPDYLHRTPSSAGDAN